MFCVLRGGVMRGQGSKTASPKQGLEAFTEIDQAVLDAIPTGFCVCRADGALLRYNTRAIQLWGRAPRIGDPTELDERNFHRYTAEGVPLAFAATPVAAALRSGVPVPAVEPLLERPDHLHTPVLMNPPPP